MYAASSERTVTRIAVVALEGVMVHDRISHGKTYLLKSLQSAVCLLGMLKMVGHTFEGTVLLGNDNASRDSEITANNISIRRIESLSFQKENILHLQKSENRTCKILWMRLREIFNSRWAEISNCPTDENNSFLDYSGIPFSPLVIRRFERRIVLSECKFSSGMREVMENPVNWNCRSFRTMQTKREERSSCVCVCHLYFVIAEETLCFPELCFLYQRSRTRWMQRRSPF